MATFSVLMVVSEALPYSKTGGLGDVGGALPAALARLGHTVTVVTPRYRGVEGGDEIAAFVRGAWLDAPPCRLLERRQNDGVRFWMLECESYFDRDGIYGTSAADYPDNHRRFALLARAALEGARARQLHPDIVHAHDWQAGLVPAYLRTRFRDDPLLGRVGSVFTIHNLAYQGVFGRQVLPSLDLPWEVFTEEGLEYWNSVSYLKSGINFSDLVTTVSRRYVEEIQTAEQGFGFEGVLQRRSRSLVGIRNGIDTTIWNPASDPLLPSSYHRGDLTGKRAVKRALLARFGMAGSDAEARPLVGMVSRMVDQKGLDLIADAARSGQLIALDASFVILGIGAEAYQQMWRDLAARHPDRVAVTVGYSEELAHLIEGGADIFLMPSRFEPCGLNQMYSLRYGTVPVVRATGGLDDTVEHVDEAAGTGTGFKFGPYTTRAMLEALRQAVACYSRPDSWARVQMAGMAMDNSWDASARAYEAAYERAHRTAGR